MLFRPSPISLSSSSSSSSSSKNWIARQFRDPFVKQRLSNPASYRSRSAFKLLEIDAAWGNFLLKPDVNVVVDLGAAPGGWSQVVAGKLGWDKEPAAYRRGGYGYGDHSEERLKRFGTWSAPKHRSSSSVDEEGERSEDDFDPLNIDGEGAPHLGRGRGIIIAMDLLRVQPIHGVHAIQADFLSPDAGRLIQGLLEAKGGSGGKVDVVLSDMAANLSGNEIHDIESSLEICEGVFEFVKRHLRSAESVGRRRAGVLLVKHFVHPLLQGFRREKLEPNFHDVKYIKPEASRTESREGYFLCQGWKGDIQGRG